eukprot:7118815-Prymnesium_polylepis.1
MAIGEALDAARLYGTDGPAAAAVVLVVRADFDHDQGDPRPLPLSDHGGHGAAGGGRLLRLVHRADGAARNAAGLAAAPAHVRARGDADGGRADLVSLGPHVGL